MNISEGLRPGDVRTVVLVRRNGSQGYNLELKDPPLNASRDVAIKPLYPFPGPVVDDGHIWIEHTWVQSLADAAVLKAILESRGPANVPGPGCAVAYFRSDEDQTGASSTTAPVDGWDTTEILISSDARLRSPDNLQVDNRI